MELTTAEGLSYQLSTAEEDYLSQTDYPGKARVALAYALALNAHQPAWLLPHLAEGVVFKNQSVKKPIEGKGALADYLGQITAALANADVTRRIRFELGFAPDNGAPCVIAHQRLGRFSLGLGERTFWLEIETGEDGTVSHFQAVTTIPSPALAQGAGLFPGVRETEIQEELAYRPELLPAKAKLDFLVFTMLPRSESDQALVESAIQVQSQLTAAEVLSCAVDPADPEAMEICRKYGINSLPTLVVEHGEEVVLRVVGVLPPEKLRERLGEVVQCKRKRRRKSS